MLKPKHIGQIFDKEVENGRDQTMHVDEQQTQTRGELPPGSESQTKSIQKL